MTREARLIIDGSPCDTNFYEGGPITVSEAKRLGRSPCPHKEKCDKHLNPNSGWQCLMLSGVHVARYVVKQGNTVAQEVASDFRNFFMQSTPPKGYVWSADRKTFVFITDKDDALKKIAEFATLAIAGRRDESASARSAPQAVGPGFDDVISYSMTKDGAIDLSRMQELEGRFGYNGGRGCDVPEGPCACGAWH